MDYTNRWALVTGASSGFGEAFAKAFAKRGANLILVARREDRLKKLAEELKTQHSIKTCVIAEDLSLPETPEHIFSKLAKEGIEVDILVNNAGYGMTGYYIDHSWKEHRDFLELMLTSYCHLVRLVLPGMQKKQFGRIIQVSSVAGLIPGSAAHTLYAPAKTFLIAFSEALAAEYREDGIHTTALCPGFTYTEFHDVNDTRKIVSKLPKFMFLYPESVVEEAIKAVEKGKVIAIPGLFYKIITTFIRLLPRSVAEALVRKRSKDFRK